MVTTVPESPRCLNVIANKLNITGAEGLTNNGYNLYPLDYILDCSYRLGD